MSGIVCLQGGRELTPGCEEMDRAVLAECEGPVVVLAGAARVGDDYDGASERAVTWYRELGATAVAAPDPRVDRDGTLAALDDVGLLVLPGGSPLQLRQIMIGPVGERARDLHSDGTGISGASAGAMVLCDRMVLPSQGRRQVDGLGLVPGLSLVHWEGPGRGRPPMDGLLRWGLPERGGVMLDDRSVRSLGQGDPSVLRAGRWTTISRTGQPHLPR